MVFLCFSVFFICRCWAETLWLSTKACSGSAAQRQRRGSRGGMNNDSLLQVLFLGAVPMSPIAILIHFSCLFEGISLFWTIACLFEDLPNPTGWPRSEVQEVRSMPSSTAMLGVWHQSMWSGQKLQGTRFRKATSRTEGKRRTRRTRDVGGLDLGWKWWKGANCRDQGAKTWDEIWKNKTT